MSDGFGGSRFAPGVQRWQQTLGQVRNAVRQELVARQIQPHLPLPVVGGEPVRVLDAGCGQGTQAIRLARAGYHVAGVDIADDLLDQATTDLSKESPEVQARVQLDRADVLTVGERFPAEFDVVCCHGVVMYLPSLSEAVRALAGRYGSVVSCRCSRATAPVLRCVPA